MCFSMILYDICCIGPGAFGIGACLFKPWVTAAVTYMSPFGYACHRAWHGVRRIFSSMPVPDPYILAVQFSRRALRIQALSF